ncbi:MAG: hypothetical protein K0Q43_2715 [Ramlibacter sp.]|jgi:hypothetical protein|nr:hypothetical protein [Ramlibacter sp.]
MAEAPRRYPTENDIVSLASALRRHGVQYVLIGGAAMAIHGFPRMTKDLDLFLPVDPENNRRLLDALKDIPNSSRAWKALRPEFMDQGYSTSFEGEIAIDLLYVAASRKFDDLRHHIKHIDFNGVQISTLDIDGMLESKQTNREEDIPDRLKLQRLRTALFEQERDRRLGALPDLARDAAPAVRLFGEMAAAALATGDPINWKQLDATVLAAGSRLGLPPDDLVEAVCSHSPGSVYPGRQAELRHAASAHSPRPSKATPRAGGAKK